MIHPSFISPTAKSEVILRDFKATDLSQVLALHKKALTDIDSYPGEGPWDKDLFEIENHYQHNHGVFLIGEVDNTIIAMGAFRKINKETAEIKRMRTEPTLQGLGIGSVMLETLLKRARNAGYNRVILETSVKQRAAIKLYQKFGFCAYRHEIIQYMDCTWYEKILNK